MHSPSYYYNRVSERVNTIMIGHPTKKLLVNRQRIRETYNDYELAMDIWCLLYNGYCAQNGLICMKCYDRFYRKKYIFKVLYNDVCNLWQHNIMQIFYKYILIWSDWLSSCSWCKFPRDNWNGSSHPIGTNCMQNKQSKIKKFNN